jgi:hypothetical protein
VALACTSDGYADIDIDFNEFFNSDHTICVRLLSTSPQRIEFNSANKNIYVSNFLSGTVSVIYTSNNLIDTIYNARRNYFRIEAIVYNKICKKRSKRRVF